MGYYFSHPRLHTSGRTFQDIEVVPIVPIF